MRLRAVAAFCVALGLSSAVLAGDAQDDLASIDKTIEAWGPKASERLFDTIGWAPSIAEAMRLAKENDRPVFLFTYSGHDMAAWRC